MYSVWIATRDVNGRIDPLTKHSATHTDLNTAFLIAGRMVRATGASVIRARNATVRGCTPTQGIVIEDPAGVLCAVIPGATLTEEDGSVTGSSTDPIAVRDAAEA